MASQPRFDPEEFWADLLAFIEDGRVIPVIGTGLLTIEENGRTQPLYRVVAERLLAKYASRASTPESPLRDGHELNDAVCAIVSDGRTRVKDLYRPVCDILRETLSRQPAPPSALRQLAEIRHFQLFATTTPDDLLTRAINQVRFGGAAQTEEIEYAPNLPNAKRRDIPELTPSKYSAVFYLFGKADASPVFAIHDEDALEFAYTLQSSLQHGVPPARMFSELRTRHLLLIGCDLADWLGRFFLRLSNEKRLSSEDRPKREFLVERTTPEDKDLTLFLERFSRDSRWYEMAPAEFVAELHRRWSERNPISESRRSEPVPPREPFSGGIFISYASDDVIAAKQLFAEVQELVGDVAWFDKTELKPGDDWDRQIKGAVARCDVFVPLISAATERRHEGYFRLEWREAVDRAKRMEGRKFIFPTVIDPDFSGGAGAYSLVPDAFKAAHYAHAPDGRMPETLAKEVGEELRAMERRRT